LYIYTNKLRIDFTAETAIMAVSSNLKDYDHAHHDFIGRTKPVRQPH
jgi:hypothetical protein